MNVFSQKRFLSAIYLFLILGLFSFLLFPKLGKAQSFLTLPSLDVTKLNIDEFLPSSDESYVEYRPQRLPQILDNNLDNNIEKPRLLAQVTGLFQQFLQGAREASRRALDALTPDFIRSARELQPLPLPPSPVSPTTPSAPVVTSPSLPSQPRTSPTPTVIERVIERVIEKVPVERGIAREVQEVPRVDVSDRLRVLEQSLQLGQKQEQLDVQNLYRVIGLSNKINSLGDITLNSPTLSGTVTISGSPNFTGIGLLGADRATVSGALSAGSTTVSGTLTVQGVATSTFSGGLQATALNITSSSASSTFANGIQLNAGCFRMSDGSCLVSAVAGSGSVNIATPNRLAYYSASSTIDSANFLTSDVANSRLGIGTTTPSQTLSVHGNALFSGNLSLANLMATGTVTANGALQASSTLQATGNTRLYGTLTVDGATTLSSTLTTGTTTATNLNQTGFAGDAGYLRTNATNLQNTNALNPGILWFGDGDTSYGADLGYNSVTGRYRSRIFGGHSGTDVALGIQNEGAGAMSSQSTFVEYLTMRGDTGNVGIGTTSPTQRLYVQGNALFSGDLILANLAATGTASVAGLATLSGGFISQASSTAVANLNAGSLNVVGALQASSTLQATGNTRLYSNLIVDSGVGIGTTSPTEQLAVAGRLYVGGPGTSTIENNLRIRGTLQVGTASIYLNDSTLNLGANSLTSTGSLSGNTLSLSGNLAASSTLQVTGATRLYSILTVDSALTASGPLQASSTLQATGAARFYNTLTVNNTLTVDGASTLSSTLTAGTTTISGGGDISVTNGATYNALKLSTGEDAMSDIGTVKLHFSQFNLSDMAEIRAVNEGGAPLNRTAGLSFWTAAPGTDGTLAERVRIKGTGNVGIGTTTPSQLLSIQGNALFSGNISSVANITATGTLSLTGTSGTSTIASGQGFTVGGSQFVVQQGSGRVGIGTTTPGANIEVASSAAVAGNQPAIRLADTAGNANSRTWAIANALGGSPYGTLGLHVSSAAGGAPSDTPSMVINNNGNVGIGTTSPAKLFSVQGNALFSGDLTLANLTATGTLTLSSGTPFNFTSLATSTIPNNLINAWSIATSTSVQPLISIMTSSSTGNVLTGAGGELGGNGRVGIGTANPISQLTVVDDDPNGTGITTINYSNSGDTSWPAFFGLGARGTKASPTASLANDVLVFLGGRGFDGSKFSVSSKGRITIRASENWSGTNQGAYMTFDTTQTGGTTRTEKMRLTDTGNLGIGTTTPSQLLSVQGNALLSGNLSLANLTATGTLTLSSGTPLNFTSSATSTIPNNLINAWSIATSTSANPILSISTAVDFSNGAIGGAHGRVGIGTANPGAQLEIVEEATSTGLRVITYMGSDANVTPFINQRSARGTANSPSASQSDDTLGAFSAGGYDGTGFPDTSKVQIRMNAAENWSPTNNGTYMTFRTTPIGDTTRLVRMKIADNGRIGIGTTTPRALLAVHGDALFSGNLTLANLTATGTMTLSGITGTSTIAHGLTIATSGGNVGIGTANPSAVKVDIAGDLRIQGPDGYNAAAERAILYLGSLSADGDRPAGILAERGFGVKIGVYKTGGTGSFGSQSLDAIAIADETGNVGIGTTTPYAKLAVVGPVVAEYFSATSTTATSTIMGALGVGTSTPSEQLAVAGRLYVGGSGTSTIENNLQVRGTLQVGTASIILNDSALNLGANSLTSTGSLSAGTSTLNNLIVTNISTSTLAGGLTVGTSQFVVQQATGNVGIGTASPTSQLHLLGITTAGTGVLFDENTVTSGTALSMTANGLTSGNGLTISSTGAGSTGNLFSVTSASTGAFANGGVRFNFTGAHTGNGVRITDATVAGEAMQIEASSLTSGKALDINANALTTGTGLSLNSSSNALAAGGKLLGLSYSGNSLAGAIFQVDDETSDITPFVIDPSGRVGIGTSTPNTRLQIADASRPQLLLTDTGGGTDAKHAYASSTAGAWAWGNLNDALSTFTERMRLTTGGNLGIGTTTPAQQLAVQGNALFSGDITVANINATGTLTLSSGTPLNFTSSATSTIPNNLINAWSIATSTSVRPLISFMTSSSTGNALTGAGGEFGGQGRIGIGTANPITQLEVVDEDPNGTGISATNYGGSGSFPTFTGLGARGTKAAPTASLMNDVLVLIGGRGFDSSQFSAQSKGRITVRASENWSSTNQGTYFTFDTTQTGGTTRTEKMRLTDTGKLGIGTTTPAQQLAVQGNALFSGDITVANINATGTLTVSGLATLGNASTTQISSTGSSYFATLGGNVGIGTTTPSFSLVINGSTGQNLFQIATSTNQGILVIDASGHVGIGTTSPQAALAVENTGDNTKPAFLIKAGGMGDGNVAIAVDADDTCRDSDGAAACALNDLAELYPTTEQLEPGDIVMFDGQNSVHLQKATQTTDNLLAGVISTSPAIVFEGSGLKALGGQYNPTPGKAPLALSGRIPVKVNLEGGDIQIGDPITISSIPGVGKKATESGKIIGYALGNYAGQNEENRGKVMVFADLSYWNAPVNNESGDGLLASVINVVKGWLESMKIFIEDGLVTLKNLVAKKVTTDELELRDKATGDLYCVSIVNGEFEKTKGECGSQNVNSESSNTDSESSTDVQPSDDDVSTVQSSDDSVSSTPAN
ncbi:MAG: hypothetical protein HZB99_01415 [Candidatus Harrisonbacteria bacterium]|nr:hypothetical protein [Candidatus Harrisonbacteria bacterium]